MSKGSSHGNVATVPSHELDQANAVWYTGGLDIGRLDHLGGHFTRGGETKGLVDQWNIVVDSLWNTREGYSDVPLLSKLR